MHKEILFYCIAAVVLYQKYQQFNGRCWRCRSWAADVSDILNSAAGVNNAGAAAVAGLLVSVMNVTRLLEWSSIVLWSGLKKIMIFFNRIFLIYLFFTSGI